MNIQIWKRVGLVYTHNLRYQTNTFIAVYNYRERRWKEPQIVYTVQLVLIEQMDSSYETELGEILNILNTAFTIVINT